MEYEVSLNGDVVTTTVYGEYTFTALRPQMNYEVQITAVSGSEQSRPLGPVTLSTANVGPVPSPDFSLLDVEDFADEDFISPQVWVNDSRNILYYYKHFHTVANAVRFAEPHRGFIDIVVHRTPEHNLPYNARVQENHLWFTYFYTNAASWNVYYGMPEVKYRLEEVLEHLLTLQSAEGLFSEYGWEAYNLPGTSFALQFLGQTVRLLNEAKQADPNFPFIDQDLYNKVIAAYRKAIIYVLNDPTMWNHGSKFTNQYTLMWSATAAYLTYYPDTAIEQKLQERFIESADVFISPAGFYYENDGYDMGYNIAVHLQNLMADYYYFKNTDLEQDLIAKEAAFFEWLSYNLVMEPDGSHFTSNASPSVRTGSGHYDRKDIPLAELIPLARAFVKTQDEVTTEITRAKNDITNNGVWPNVPPLALTGGNSYNPYGLYNRILTRYYPEEAERATAIQMLPYMASDLFNHQRVDERIQAQFTYVRRPDYYAAFNAGVRKANMQVFGLGLLWHPEGGIMLSSQTENDSTSTNRDLSWGTKNANSQRVYENGNVLPTYSINGQSIQPTNGYGDLAHGDLKVEYNLGNSGDKTITFVDEGIIVGVNHQGMFTERIPLMLDEEDVITLEDGLLTLTRGHAVLTITFDEDAVADLIQKSYRIYNYRMHMLTLTSSDTLNYQITMSTNIDP